LSVKQRLFDFTVVGQHGPVADSQTLSSLALGGAKILNAFVSDQPGAFLGKQSSEALVGAGAVGHGRSPGARRGEITDHWL